MFCEAFNSKTKLWYSVPSNVRNIICSRDVQKPQVQSMCKHLEGGFKLRTVSWPRNSCMRLYKDYAASVSLQTWGTSELRRETLQESLSTCL